MANIKEVLQKNKNMVKASRLFWNVESGEEKPDTFYTFQRVNRSTIINADDVSKTKKDTWLVRIISKNDFEELLEETISLLEEAGYYINSVDQENYEKETGYWIVPITVQDVKE